MDNNLFFFYGSLRTGYWNQRILSKDAVKLGNSTTVDNFELFVGPGENQTVPTVIPESGKNVLHGELYKLNEADQRSVFALEAGYEHDEFEVVCEGRHYMAYIFHHKHLDDCKYIRGGCELIPGGDYTQAIAPTGEKRKF